MEQVESQVYPRVSSQVSMWERGKLSQREVDSCWHHNGSRGIEARAGDKWGRGEGEGQSKVERVEPSRFQRNQGTFRVRDLWEGKPWKVMRQCSESVVLRWKLWGWWSNQERQGSGMHDHGDGWIEVENKVFASNGREKLWCQGVFVACLQKDQGHWVWQFRHWWTTAEAGVKNFRAGDRMEEQTCFKKARSLGKKEETVMSSRSHLTSNPRYR